MKDNFSENSADYATYRPAYPKAVYNFLKQLLPETTRAWDCGTGNGQVAGELATFFREVHATDISENQLKNAVRKPSIHYSVQPAEKTDFPNAFFDLVVVAQAIHWFDFDRFYAEVRRTLKPTGYLAVLGYGLLRSNAETNKIIDHFYNQIIGPYWDEERRYLEEEYRSIPFPFEEEEVPCLENRQQWDLERLLGYLGTWSAVKHYREANGEDPVAQIAEDLSKSFGESDVVFPVLFRVGKIDARYEK